MAFAQSNSSSSGRDSSPERNRSRSSRRSSRRSRSSSSRRSHNRLKISARAPSTFSQQVSIKLDSNNFLSWKQQVEGIIRGHKLQRFLVNPTIPPRFLTTVDREVGSVNPAYTEWEQQDSLLFTWLLSTLSDTLLPRVVRCVHSWQVWEEIHKFFRAQMNARSKQLRSELKSITKGNRSISEYLARIQTIVDILMSIGDPVSHRDHLEAIVEGLPEEYGALAAIIQYRTDLCDILDAESMLLSHEAKLDKHKKLLLADPLVNVAQAVPVPQPPQNVFQNQSYPVPPQNFQAQNIQNPNCASDSHNDEDYDDRGGRGGDRGGRGGDRGGRSGGRGGRSGGRSKVQCQICQKFGHDASVCWNRNANLGQTNWTGPGQGQNPVQSSWTGPSQGQCSWTGPPMFSGPTHSQWNVPIMWPSNWTGPFATNPLAGPNWNGPNNTWNGPVNSWTTPSNSWNGSSSLSGSSRPLSLPSPSHSTVSSASQSTPRNFTQPQAYFAGSDSAASHLRDQAWFPDSGATHHVTNNPSNLLDSISLPGSDQVLLGNGQGLPILSIGKAHLTSPYAPRTALKLDNLLLVPGITKNLISVSQFAKDNAVYFEFHPTFCVVKSQGTSEVLLRGELGEDGLYRFGDTLPSNNLPAATVSRLAGQPSVNSVQCSTNCNTNTSTSHSSSNTSIGPTNYTMWHYRLGHPHHEALKTILSLCKISVPNKSYMDFCTACCFGKVHRLPSHTSRTVYDSPFQLLYCDLWGPAPMVSSCDYKYMLTCVDACTKYTWVFPLKLKSDTYATFRHFKAMVEVQFGTKIKSVQTDGGGEFRALAAYFNECGITHRLACPHTHHQNGSVERKHRHVVETGLTLLAQAGLPFQFWDHAFLTATYLINRMPTAVLQMQSPYYTLYKQQPDYSFLKVFGCACYPHIRPYNSHKLDFHTKECVFLGYSSSHKGYKCLAADGRIYISKDVIFNEFKFPYMELFPKAEISAFHPPTNSPVTPLIVIPPHSSQGQSSTTSSQSPQQSVSHNSQLQPSHSGSTSPVHTAEHFSGANSENHTAGPASPALTAEHESPAHTAVHFSGANSENHTAGSASSVENNSPSSASACSNSIDSTTESDSDLSNPLVFIHPDNIHPMRTRGKDGIVKPRLQPTLLLTEAEPTSYKAALNDPKWLEAMTDEFQALIRNNTWKLVPLPSQRKVIGCKWVFRIKQNPDGSLQKYKARLVAKGFHQVHGFDFKETFSPVVKPVTVRTVLTLAISRGWYIKQLDVNNAFLNGILEEEVYMQQPPGFESSDKKLVCRLQKAIYGLKQAPRAWFERLATTLIQFGFQTSKCDPSLFTFTSDGHHVIMLIYVDDIIVTGDHLPLIQSLTNKLNEQFALKQLGDLEYFLGIEVKRLQDGSLFLSQTKYVRDLLAKANMLDAKSLPTPMISSAKLSKHGTDLLEDASFYRSIVGALQYATITRPEICFSVNKACQFLSQPLDSHWKSVKRILRYLSGTLHHGLLLQPSSPHTPISLTAFSDADWGSDPDDRKSTSGSCIYLGPNLVSWWSKKQNLVARSSTEAEYRSLANTAAEVLWIQSLLTELKVPFQTPVLYCDNLSTVSLSHNPVLHAKTKHMELDIFFLREKVINKSLIVNHLPAQDQIADLLTKPLSSLRFLTLRDKLRVVDKTVIAHIRGEQPSSV